MADSRPARTAIALGLLAAAAFYVVWIARAQGIVALSDDDYARVVIATDTARAPRLDPSGTSWLPFPFWIYGAAIRLGSALAIAPLVAARLVPYALSVLSCWLVYGGARAAGLSRYGALLAASIGVGTQQVAQLAGLCVPEHPTAALCSFALLAQSAADDPQAPRVGMGYWGALAVGCAALSRYEAWPVAAVFALCAITGGARRQGLLQAAIALAGPLAWLAHNHAAHGSALHFLGRVAAYREALGTRGDRLTIVLAYGRALVFASPAISVALVLVAARAQKSGVRPGRAATLAVLASLAFLVLGALLGGVPTHHPERALALVWLLGGVLIARDGSLALLLGVVQLAVLPWTIGNSDGFSRRDEEALGAIARAELGPHDRLFVATPDYGYFAVLASFGDSTRAALDARHDPRHPDAPSRLGELDVLAREGVRRVVAPVGALVGAQERARSGRLALYALPAEQARPP